MRVVRAPILFTTFQIVFGTTFWIFITQKGNLPVSEGFPLILNNEKTQAKIIQSWIRLGLNHILDVVYFKYCLGITTTTAP